MSQQPQNRHANSLHIFSSALSPDTNLMIEWKLSRTRWRHFSQTDRARDALDQKRICNGNILTNMKTPESSDNSLEERNMHRFCTHFLTLIVVLSTQHQTLSIFDTLSLSKRCTLAINYNSSCFFLYHIVHTVPRHNSY